MGSSHFQLTHNLAVTSTSAGRAADYGLHNEATTGEKKGTRHEFGDAIKYYSTTYGEFVEIRVSCIHSDGTTDILGLSPVFHVVGKTNFCKLIATFQRDGPIGSPFNLQFTLSFHISCERREKWQRSVTSRSRWPAALSDVCLAGKASCIDMPTLRNFAEIPRECFAKRFFFRKRGENVLGKW